MPAVAVAAVGTAISAYQANRASHQARDSARQQADAQQQQIELGREQLAEGRRRYDQWSDMFMPGFQELGDMAFQDSRPDYQAITADVGTAFDTSQQITRRNQERLGINPTDGAASASETQYGIGRALALAGGRNRARTQSTNDRWNRIAAFANSGNSLYGGANSMIQAAYGGLNSAFGGQASAAGQNAAYMNNQSNNAWNDVGYGIGQIAQNWPSSQQTPPPIPISPVTRTPPGGG